MTGTKPANIVVIHIGEGYVSVQSADSSEEKCAELASSLVEKFMKRGGHA